MPIFEYACRKCGASFEALVAPADAQPSCAACGSKRIEKQLSTFSAGVAATRSPSPCAGGGCPSDGMAGSGCSGGCPYR